MEMKRTMNNQNSFEKYILWEKKNRLLVLSKGQANSWGKLTLINMNPQHIIIYSIYYYYYYV